MKNLIGWKKYLISVWSILETFLFGGIWVGWGSLVFVFKEEGIYADLCQINGSSEAQSKIQQNFTDSETSICVSQDEMFALAFTITTMVFSVNAAVAGHTTYKFGIRVTRIAGIIAFMAGSLMLAFVSVDVPWLVFPGMSLIAIGGFPSLTTNSQISNLFDKGRATFLCVLNGTFGISSVVMALLKIAFENGISRKFSFIFICSSHSIVLISTLFLFPKSFISKPSQEPIDISLECNGEGMQEEHENNLVPKKMTENNEEGSIPSLKMCILSRTYMLHLLWFSLLQLRFFHFIGSLNTFLNRRLTGNIKMVSYYTNICYFIMLSDFVNSFLLGMLFDWQRHVFIGSKSKERRELMPAVLPLFIGCFMAVLTSVLVLVPEPEVLYLTFAVMTMLRSSLYGMTSAFIGAVFPMEYFSMMHGITLTIGGCLTFLQYGFFTWADLYDEAQEHASIAMLCLVALSLAHPSYQWLASRRAEKGVPRNDTTQDGKKTSAVI